MAHCGVCACKLYDATENYGSFPVSVSFVGWNTTKLGGRCVISDTCETCHKKLSEAVAKIANKISAKHADKVTAMSREMETYQEAEKRVKEEKVAFEKAWNKRRRDVLANNCQAKT